MGIFTVPTFIINLSQVFGEYSTHMEYGGDVKYWLVVSTHLKNINQIGNLPQVGVKI